MEGGCRQSVSFKYTDSIQRHGAKAQGIGKMMTNTEVSAQDKAEDCSTYISKTWKKG